KSLNIQGPGTAQLAISGGGSRGAPGVGIDGGRTNATPSGLSVIHGGGECFTWGGSPCDQKQATDRPGGGSLDGGGVSINGCVLTGNAVDENQVPNGRSFLGGAIYNAGGTHPG